MAVVALAPGLLRPSAKLPNLPEPAGCEDCRGTGFRGRSALAELVEINDTIRELILERRPSGEIYAAAEAGGTVRLRAAAMGKAVSGTTSVAEMNRVSFAE